MSYGFPSRSQRKRSAVLSRGRSWGFASVSGRFLVFAYHSPPLCFFGLLKARVHISPLSLLHLLLSQVWGSAAHWGCSDVPKPNSRARWSCDGWEERGEDVQQQQRTAPKHLCSCLLREESTPHLSLGDKTTGRVHWQPSKGRSTSKHCYFYRFSLWSSPYLSTEPHFSIWPIYLSFCK